MTDDPDVRIATSVMDYLFRRIALDYLPLEKRAELGIFTADERTQQVSAAYGGEPSAVEEAIVEDLRTTVDATPVIRPAVREWRRCRFGCRCGGRGPDRHGLDDRSGGLVDGAAGAGDRQVRRRAAVLHLRDEDASVRRVLPLRGLRLDLAAAADAELRARPWIPSLIRGRARPLFGV